MDGFVDDLAEAEAKGDAAEDVGVDRGEAPAADEQIDHAAGGGAGGFGEVGAGLDDDPGVGGGVGRDGLRWLRRWGWRAAAACEGGSARVTSSGHSIPLMQTSPSPCAAWPSPQLKRAPWIEDGEIELGAGAEFAHVEVAAEGAGGTGAECAIVCAGYAHDAEEGTQRDDGRGH